MKHIEVLLFFTVSNKNFIENLAREYHLDLSDKQGLKYPANFDVVHQILTVNL